jgi:hypothetical protein
MKIIIAIFIIYSTILNANIEIHQNIKALYKGVTLTETQEDYILDNQENNIDVLKKSMKKELRSLNKKNLNEKNVVSFVLEPSGKVSKIKFLRHSDNRKLDKATKKAIINASKKFVKTSEKVQMRFILSYRIGQVKSSGRDTQNKYSKNSVTAKTREAYFIPIANGTTRFQHSSEEYVRVFETSRDGFVNASLNPQTCGSIKLLTNDNQRIHTGYAPWQFNTEIPKGKYKFLIKTKKVCDVSLQYL